MRQDSPIGQNREENEMRDLILWFAGVPLVVIVGLHLVGFLS